MMPGWFLSVLAATATPSPLLSPAPSGPVYVGAPAARLTLEGRSLGVDADGEARWLVIARYLDAHGRPTKIMLNSDIDWMPDRGAVQWQPRMRFGQPSAIVRLRDLQPVRLRAHSNVPKLSDAYASTDPAQWRTPREVAQPLGPHLIQIGWFPQAHGVMRITRRDAHGAINTFLVQPPSSTYRDTGVLPGRTYRYRLQEAGHASRVLPAVQAMPEAPRATISAVSGKGMWLYFGTNPYDDHYIGTWNAQAYVDRAVSAGLHYVELRTAYGAYWEVDAQSRATVDNIIDGLAAHGIGTVAWTVPRQASFEDLSATVRSAYYRTARGTPMAGLAVDLERGELFMHDCPEGCHAMRDYMLHLRQALGANYPITATVEDPYLERLDAKAYPFASIAAQASVLQPMAYWRMIRKDSTSVPQMEALLQGSYRTTLQLAKRALPISIGGQTSNESARGNPPPEEITASLAQSKALGAIGECFFDWDGTLPQQWDAIAAYRW